MARSFASASTHYAVHTANGIVTAAPISMACFFRVPEITTRHFILSTYYLGGSNDRFALQLWGHIGGDPVAFQVFETSGGLQDTATTSTGYSANVWQHAAGVKVASGNTYAYLNGGSKGTDSAHSATPANIDQARIAAFPGGFYANCEIAEAAIWNIVLTDAEVAILALGYSPLLIRPQNLVAYWPLIGRMSPEIDIVGGFDMVLINAPGTIPQPPVFRPAINQILTPNSEIYVPRPGVALVSSMGVINV